MALHREELERFNRRILVPLGGSIQAIAHDLELFPDILQGLKIGDDLQFSVPDYDTGRARRLWRRMTSVRILEEAKKKFSKEDYHARRILTSQDVSGCKFTYIAKKIFRGPSVQAATRGRPTLYGMGIVQVDCPPLVNVKLASDERTELVLPEQLKAKAGATTSRQSFIPPVYHCLV